MKLRAALVAISLVLAGVLFMTWGPGATRGPSGGSAYDAPGAPMREVRSAPGIEESAVPGPAMQEKLAGMFAQHVETTAAVADGVVVRCTVPPETPNGWVVSDHARDPLNHSIVPMLDGQLHVPVRLETETVRVRFNGLSTMTFLVDGAVGTCRSLGTTDVSAIVGVVVDPDGRPLPEVRLAGCEDWTFTGPDGTFALLEASVGSCELEVHDCTDAVLARTTMTVKAGKDLLNVRVVATKAPKTCGGINFRQAGPPEIEYALCVLAEGESVMAEFNAGMNPGAADDIRDAAQREALSLEQQKRCRVLMAKFAAEDAPAE